MALVDIINNAGGKLGGFGDAINGEAFLENLTGTDKVTTWVNAKYPVIRQKIIYDFAAFECPFRETLKFADLGDDLKQDDVEIESIAVGATPTFTVTVTTAEAHGKTNGDTVFLADIEGTLVTSLNGTTKTITFVDTTSFTLDDTVGTASWEHTANTGIVSKCPEIGAWQYAFTLPSDYFCMVRHCDEIAIDGVRKKYQYQPILNIDGDGLLLLTNDLTNADGDSAYIEYCIDQDDTTLWSPQFIECVAALLAVELCPILGRDIETKRRMSIEYAYVYEPAAKRANQSQCNNRAKTIQSYSSNKSTQYVSARNTGLGHYVDAEGNRREV